MKHKESLALSLFLLRVSIFVVMLMWTLDKFVRPGHASAIFEKFYGLSGLASSMMIGLAIAEIILLILFLLGIFKSFSYLAVLLLHTVSTLSAFGAYLSPFSANHLLFFAAIPMWAACVCLYLMREEDTWVWQPRRFKH